MRDLFEAVERIEDTQLDQGKSLISIASTLDEMQKRINEACGTTKAHGEVPRRRSGVTAQPDSREDLNASPTIDHHKRRTT